jgi:formylglycine-generating enzyme required for sulfatase activity
LIESAKDKPVAEAERRTLRVFISSPGDVRPERLKAEQIVARLDREFMYYFHVASVLWEREPLVATHHFQDPENIPEPHGTDIVVVIMWSQLGVPLPADKFRGAVSGRCPVTGTEWEFEDALAGARERNGVPQLLLYRKTAEPVSSLTDRSAVQQRLRQLDLVEDFFVRWFRSADGESLSAASHNFASTVEFEDQLYHHLRELLERRAGAATTGGTIHWHEAPFRALLSYDYEHAPVFFGRTQARNELRELLARQIARGTAFVLVFGASGSGKSSLVKAGLLADLALPGMMGRVALVRYGVLRPSDCDGKPIEALAAAMVQRSEALPELALDPLDYSVELLAGLLRDAPSHAASPIRQALGQAERAGGLSEAGEARLVIVVDQLEELFTQDRLSPAEREAFVKALEALAKSGLVWVVATMRSDFFDRLETLPLLATLSADSGRFLLLSPNESEIGQIIRQPAREAALRFEIHPTRAQGLDEVIQQATSRATGALPLLSFLLDQLWLRRTREGLLTFAAYRELGGLEGAIGRRAEEVFRNQSDAVRHELPALLRKLVTVSAGATVARPAPLQQFAKGSPLRVLADAFLDPQARLLVAEGDTGTAQLRLAHEALLTRWSRARDQVAADARDLELRARLEEEAARWRAASHHNKRDRVLPIGLRLVEGMALCDRWGAELPAEVTAFVNASRRVARSNRRFRMATVAGAVVALPIIAVFIWAGLTAWGVRAVEAEMEFVPISAGCFQMGSPDTETERYPNEGPRHEVCPKAFELGKFEVTQAEWRQVMIYNRDPSEYKGDRRPVENVSWDEAQWFIFWMNSFGRHHYRLPSEAEWEFAARAGTTTARYWGDRAEDGCAYENMRDQSLKRLLPDWVVANCDDRQPLTAPVGTFKPNPWGLYDILGNVAEWVEDCYVEDYKEVSLKDGSATTSKDCSSRVVRGGSWGNAPRTLRAAYRLGFKPNDRGNNIGFRLARSVS